MIRLAGAGYADVEAIAKAGMAAMSEKFKEMGEQVYVDADEGEGEQSGCCSSILPARRSMVRYDEHAEFQIARRDIQKAWIEENTPLLPTRSKRDEPTTIVS